MRSRRISEAERCALGLRHWPQAYKNSSLLLSKLLRTADLLEHLFVPLFARHKLQASDFDVLATLRMFGAPYELSPTTIYQSRFSSSGGLTKTLHRLEKAKLIARRADPQDKRSLLVRLTPKGKRLIETATQDLRAAKKRMLADFSSGELAGACAALDKLMARLEPAVQSSDANFHDADIH